MADTDHSLSSDAGATLSQDPTTAPTGAPRRWKRVVIVAGACVAAVVVGAGALAFAGSRVSIDSGGGALAGVSLPLGASVSSITATDARGEQVPAGQVALFTKRLEELLREDAEIALTPLAEDDLNLDDNEIPHAALAVLLEYLVDGGPRD